MFSADMFSQKRFDFFRKCIFLGLIILGAFRNVFVHRGYGGLLFHICYYTYILKDFPLLPFQRLSV